MIFVVLPALIYLAGRIFGILISTPPWAYCAFCGLGLVLLILAGKWGMQVDKKAEIQRNIYNEAAEEFARNILAKPIETKMLYIDLKDKFKEYQMSTGYRVNDLIEADENDILKDSNTTGVQKIKVEILDIANKLYKKETVSQRLIEDLDKKLFSIESDEVAEGIEIYMQKLDEDPEEARRAIAEVRKELAHNRRLGLELSQKLFNGKAYLHYGTIDLINSGCREKIRENAKSTIRERMQSNPELTKKLYQELEDAMKINNTNLTYDLCEKLIGNRYLSIFDISLVMVGSRKDFKRG